MKRKRLSEESKAIDLVDRLLSDFFFLEKLLLNGIGLRLNLVRNKDSHVLLFGTRDAAFKVSITKAMLRAKIVRFGSCVTGSRESAGTLERQISDRQSRMQFVFRACAVCR